MEPRWFVWGLVLLVGLCMGSFLNVVITRLPVMLMKQWRNEALAALEQPEDTQAPFNLMWPRSLCPACLTPLHWHDNLPLIGWLKRHGRCATCNGRISLQYPLIELAGGIIALATVALFGLHWQTLFIAAACYSLLAMAVIDLRTQLLPDCLTLPLLWAGLVYQLLFQPLLLPAAVMGAITGYLVLWSLYWLFKLTTGKEGMGYGDFKLLAALGAWVGWQTLPLILIISAGAGALFGLAWQFVDKSQRGMPMPFGPFLAIGGWVALLMGDTLIALYLAALSI